jgi:hypothetical protein
MNLWRWQIHLIDDWHRCWRFASMRWSAGGIGFNLIAASLVKGITISVSFVGFIPLVWLPLIAVAITVLTMIGRVSKKTPKTPKVQT